MSSIVLEIKGQPWNFILIPDKRFDRMHNSENESNTAMTLTNARECHFRKSDWCVVDIIHELGHVLYASSPTRSADLSPDDVEEIMCDIYSSDYFQIGVWAGRIAEKFFGRKD